MSVVAPCPVSPVSPLLRQCSTIPSLPPLPWSGTAHKPQSTQRDATINDYLAPFTTPMNVQRHTQPPPKSTTGVLFPIDSTKQSIRAHLKPLINSFSRPLRLVGVLASDNVGSGIYSNITRTVCRGLGVAYDLVDMKGRSVEEVKRAVRDLSADGSVDGVIFYTPAFSLNEDEEIRRCIAERVDVEGLGEGLWDEATTARIESMEEGSNVVYPPTPLAVMRALQLHAYDLGAKPGEQLKGRTAVVINRSRTVGLPLAHMLANEGALVHSIDVDSAYICTRSGSHHSWLPTTLSPAEMYSSADIIISAVPSASFVVPVKQIKSGAMTVNVASPYDNFVTLDTEQDQDVLLQKVGWHCPKMGALTILCLVGNVATLRLRSERV